jgi:hypothetical protein
VSLASGAVAWARIEWAPAWREDVLNPG